MLISWQAQFQRTLNANEVQMLKIFRVVNRWHLRGATYPGGNFILRNCRTCSQNIINHVAVTAVEHRPLAFPAATRRPQQPAFIIPGAFWPKQRIPQVCGIVIIQIGVTRQAKRAANTSFQLQSVSQPNPCSQRRIEFAMGTAEDFLPRRCGKGKPFQRANIVAEINRTPAAIVITQIVALNAFMNSLGTIEQCRILRDLLVPPQVRLPTFVDVVVLEKCRIIAKENEFIRVAAKSEIEFRLAS